MFYDKKRSGALFMEFCAFLEKFFAKILDSNIFL